MLYDAHIHCDGELGLKESAEYFNDFFKAHNIDKANVVSYSYEAEVDFPISDFKCLWLKKQMSPRLYGFMTMYHNFDGRDTKEYYLHQLEAGIEMGFDGWKNLDGKPNCRKRLGRSLADECFDLAYKKAEELQFPIIYHVADPEYFWSLPSERKWSYSDPSFATKEQLYSEIDELLTKFPDLNITFAHFYFMSEDLNRAARFLDDHPNIKFDLAPGREMFGDFSKNLPEARAFFEKYRERILFGSDINNSLKADKYNRFAYNLLEVGLTAGETFTAIDCEVTPLELSDDVLEYIKHKNFIKLCGENPKPVNEQAVRKHLAEFIKNTERLSQKDQEEISEIAKAFGL